MLLNRSLGTVITAIVIGTGLAITITGTVIAVTADRTALFGAVMAAGGKITADPSN